MYYIKITLKDNQIIDYNDEYRTLEEIKALYNKALKEDIFFIETRDVVTFVRPENISAVFIQNVKE